MNIKKLIVAGSAAALMLGSTVPALAWGSRGSSDVAIIGNSATAIANTGSNVQGNGVYADDDIKGGTTNVSGNNDIDTGDADASAGALVVANTHVGCNCDGGRRHKDFAVVDNTAEAGANTGDNGQGNYVEAGDDIGSWDEGGTTNVSGNNTADTGKANSKARAWTVVNTHVNWD